MPEVVSIAYIRYKVSEDMHKIIRDVCAKLGMKESEISRTAVMEYLKSIGVFSEKILSKNTGKSKQKGQ